MNPPAPPPEISNRASGVGKRFGRFELRRLIGKSERAMVWLVDDPRGRQPLMLTLPRVPPVDDAGLQRWLRDAQTALRLDHPRLAGGVEVGSHERWPFLAVDRRRGVTVGEWLERNPAPSPLEVVGWLSQALEGLAFAHEAGVVHGDLQLHSLLIDDHGGLRVMALATAGEARTAAPSPGAGSGTLPPFLPAGPLQAAAAGADHGTGQRRSQREAAERDVLACGLLLHRLLAGTPPLDEADTGRVVERLPPLGRDTVRLPWTTPQPVPEALRVIANRATSNQDRQRYLNARTLLRALHGWAETEGQDRGGPLALLIDRLRSVGHLPAMPGASGRVERLTRREGQHTDAIAEEILQDMALSFEMLRLVNAAQVQSSQFGGGAPVLTVRRCVALIGLDGVRQAAAQLRRWPGPLGDSAAAAMDRTVQLVRLAALTAQRLRPAGYDPEVVYLVTLLQNLGRLLVQYHFPDEAEQIRQLMLPQPPVPGSGRSAPGMSESMASLAVLGVDVDALGSAVTRHWALGEDVLHMGRRLPLERPVAAPDGDDDMLRLVASCACEAVDAMARPDSPPRKQLAMSAVERRYARALELGPRDLQEALQSARAALQAGTPVVAAGTPAGDDARGGPLRPGGGGGGTAGGAGRARRAAAPRQRADRRAGARRLPGGTGLMVADAGRGSPSVAAPAARRRVGRFELCRELGRGAQATVWLAFDPRLERDVALKLLSAASRAADEQDVTHWLREARSVARLNHPNIVPVFEADVDDGRPFLVFEYVPGRTLTEHLRARGALPPHEALALLLDVLDALAAAHAGGVVHRDLKPSNVLVDGAGRARVMDFGIAARLLPGPPPAHGTPAAAAPTIAGTPAYMSPEAVRGAAPTAAMDVFSAGALAAELLTGRPLLREVDPSRALQRMADEPLALPDDELPATVDDALRAILRSAIARDPAQRPAGAAAFAAALRGWMAPPAAAGESSAAALSAAARRSAHNSGTLDFLLRRMRHRTDFPALSDSVAHILRIATSDSESLGSLAAEILKDVALTHKLLRLVNSAHYGHGVEGDGAVSTVSRAVALVGFAGIRNMALSLLLLEHMHDKAHAERLKGEFLRSLMAGSLAGALCGSGAPRDGEEAFVAAMFQNLGRLLVEFYFPEEAGQIRNLAAASLRDAAAHGRAAAAALPAWQADAEAAASISVLGLSLDELGAGIARSWQLPEPLLRGMRRPDGAPPARPAGAGVERLRWLARAANELTDALLHADGGGEAGEAVAAARLTAVAERHAQAIGCSVAEIRSATQTARERLAQMARAMKLQLAPGAAARRLLEPAGAAPRPASNANGSAGCAVDASRPPATPVAAASGYAATRVEAPRSPAPPADAAAQRDKATDLLAAGLADVSHSMVDAFKLNDVLRSILGTMHRAIGFRRVVFCLRDARTSTLTGRFGEGDAADTVAPQFRIRLPGHAGADADLFAAVCAKGADTLIGDAGGAGIAARLPSWYRGAVAAPAFLLLPLVMKGATFGLIYADYATRPDGCLGDKELSLLRALRNQAVMAFRQIG